MTPSETRQKVFDALWKSLISRGVVVMDGDVQRSLMSTDVWPLADVAIEAAGVENLIAENKQQLFELTSYSDEAAHLMIQCSILEARIEKLRAAAQEAADWLDSRPDMTEGDVATSTTLRLALEKDPRRDTGESP